MACAIAQRQHNPGAQAGLGEQGGECLKRLDTAQQKGLGRDVL